MRQTNTRGVREAPEVPVEPGPRAGNASGGSRVARTMIRHDLNSACSILVDQGLCSAEELAERVSATLQMANADYLVADEDGVIVDVTLSVFDGFSSFVSYMAVVPDSERRQIGREIIEELVRRTRVRGGKDIVVASWLYAAGFYHRMEFHILGSVFLVRIL